MRIVLVLVAALLTVAASCDTPTFTCVDDLQVGDGEWTCWCDADASPCDGVGGCLDCPAL